MCLSCVLLCCIHVVILYMCVCVMSALVFFPIILFLDMEKADRKSPALDLYSVV